MSDLIKGYIGKEDFQIQTNTNAPEQFQRLMSVGGMMNLYKMPDIWNRTGRINPRVIDTVVTKSPWIDVTHPDYGSGIIGTGDWGTQISNAISDVPPNGTLLFPPGIYPYVTSPNFAVTGLNIIGLGSTLKHIGGGDAFSLDGGATGSGVWGMSISDLIIQGGATSDNGIFAQSVHHSNFTNLNVTGCATTGNALLTRWCVANTWTNFRASSNEGWVGPQPLNGIYLANRASGGLTTTQTFINPIIEGVSNAGIYLYYCNDNHFIGGTSEANAYGIYADDNGISHPAGANLFSGIDLEGNSINDIYITAGGAGLNTFLGIYALGSSEILTGYNKFIGGTIYTLTLGVASYHNRLIGIDIPVAFTDNNSSFTNSYNSVMGPGAAMLPNTDESLTGPAYRTTVDNAAPTTGTWRVGDKCFNGNPTTGQPIGWMCTVAGTGLGATWKSMGNLQ
jgi:hypothetical protein